MKTTMKTTRPTAKTIIAALVVGLALATPLHAQANKTMPMPGNGMGTADKMSGGMMGGGGMMQMHEKMQADMKAMDDELDGLIVKMNQSSGPDKMDAMAAVITKMAQQRKMMDQKMAAMQASMMQCMMGNMGGMKMTPPMTMPQGK